MFGTGITDMKTFLDVYPHFQFRFLLVVVLFVIFFIVVMKLREKEYIKMVTGKDSVTGLMNWEKFKENVREVISKSSEKNYALIQFDVDKFKVINDMYGIDGGNSTLRGIAGELVGLIDKNELATRFYADVFCVLISYKNDDEIPDLSIH